MLTLYVGLAALLGLVAAAIFLPVLWIPVAILLAVGIVYAWALIRGAGRRQEGRPPA